MTTNPNDKDALSNNGTVSHDYSKASDSSITSTDEDKAKLKALSEMLGIDQIREDTDKLNTSMTYLADKMGQIAKIIDAQSKMINGLNPNTVTTTQQNDPLTKLTQYGELLEKASPLIEKLLGRGHDTPLIDNNTIQEKMKQTFFDNLETGESINQFIKNALKKSVTKQVINTSLADIGKGTIDNHGPT